MGLERHPVLEVAQASGLCLKRIKSTDREVYATEEMAVNERAMQDRFFICICFKSGVALCLPPQSKTLSRISNATDFACRFESGTGLRPVLEKV